MPSLKARIRITNYCENNCWYCSNKKKDNDFMDEETLDKTIKFLSNSYTNNNFNRIKIGITGGNPFFDEYILEVVDKIKNTFSKDMTSADLCSMADMNIVDKFVKKGGFCWVSLNEDSLSEAVDRVLYLGTDKAYCLNVVLTEYNIERIDNIINQTIKHKLPLRVDHIFDPEDKYNLVEKANECVDYIFSRFERDNYLIYPYQYIMGFIHPNKHKAYSYCGYGTDQFYFDIQGNIRRCVMEDNCSSVFKEWYDVFNDINCEQKILDDCVSCIAYPYCKGGCAFTNSNFLYCDMYKRAALYFKRMGI